jgi:hypothetical protein
MCSGRARWGIFAGIRVGGRDPERPVEVADKVTGEIGDEGADLRLAALWEWEVPAAVGGGGSAVWGGAAGGGGGGGVGWGTGMSNILVMAKILFFV